MTNAIATVILLNCFLHRRARRDDSVCDFDDDPDWHKHTQQITIISPARLCPRAQAWPAAVRCVSLCQTHRMRAHAYHRFTIYLSMCHTDARLITGAYNCDFLLKTVAHAIDGRTSHHTIDVHLTPVRIQQSEEEPPVWWHRAWHTHSRHCAANWPDDRIKW